MRGADQRIGTLFIYPKRRRGYSGGGLSLWCSRWGASLCSGVFGPRRAAGITRGGGSWLTGDSHPVFEFLLVVGACCGAETLGGGGIGAG